MRIALVSEGTYPFNIGGVSTWCDQLIRGFPEHRWEMVALTVDGGEQPLWAAPGNLAKLQRIPLWGHSPAGLRLGRLKGARRPGSAFASSYEALLKAMLTPQDPRSNQAMVARSRFLLALHGLSEYADGGGDLPAALTSNAALAQLIAVWTEIRQSELNLADALKAANLLEHMLRPLSAPSVNSDLVHSAMNGLSMLVAMKAKWRYGTPLVMSEHGNYLRERYLWFLEERAPYPVRAIVLGFHRSLAGAGYLIADGLAAHSSYNRRWQLHNGADPDRMWTMYNGVELEEFPVAETEPDHPTVAFMGRIDPIKDLHTLIRAIGHVRAKVRGARLRIFGSATPTTEAYARSCRQLIADLDLADAVTMEGAISTPAVAYHAATIVALTSVSEGFPAVLVEAMACGRPIVCTNVGGVSEAVADAGIVVPPGDYLAVAQACVTLLQDGEMRQRMAQAARSRVVRLFTLGESLAAYRRVYDHVTAAEAPHVAAVPESLPEPQLPVPQVPEPLAPPAVRPSRAGLALKSRALGRVRVVAGEVQ